jgi:predicted nucleic acid-binding protein
LIAIADTGVLVAALNVADPHHAKALRVLEDIRYELVIPVLCIGEACYLIDRDLGPIAEAEFLEGLTNWEVLAPEPDDWARVADLVVQYRDFPLGAVDASIVALAERLDCDTILTLDRRHFSVVVPKHRDHFQLLPGD